MAQIYSVYIVSFENGKSLPMPMKIYLKNMSPMLIFLLFIKTVRKLISDIPLLN